MIRAVAAILFACGAHPALACPTSADLEDGIVLTSGKPSAPIKMAVRRVTPDLIWSSQSSAMFPDAWSMLYHGGVFPLHRQKNSGAAESSSRYAKPLPGISAFLEGGTFTTQRQWGPPDESKVWDGDITYTVEAGDQIDIGGCVYDTILIREEGPTVYPDGASKTLYSQIRFLPELAVSVTYSQPFKVERAGWFDGILSDRDLRKRARSTPALRAVLERYGVIE